MCKGIPLNKTGIFRWVCTFLHRYNTVTTKKCFDIHPHHENFEAIQRHVGTAVRRFNVDQNSEFKCATLKEKFSITKKKRHRGVEMEHFLADLLLVENRNRKQITF